ncbi:amino acid ABC transporter permease [uncultured Sneathiella sp.]|jgi:general L-amino acid transport system permease protein|uniref:amino acid ABC transporter permease n=3 Tax=uncultured Sneathiella sp. TaxID=879315 RepID=UPI0030D71D27|tara:strand:+ start:5629 stop:6822 length:1194 start_codon:yes stop_codon:yes gene_type:complete
MTAEAADLEVAKLSKFRDPRYRAIFYQIVVIALFILFVAYVSHNTAVNLEKRGIASGFGFLSQPSGFGIGIVLLMDYSSQTSTHLDVLIIGIINTLAVSISGIFLATLIGFIFGVLRLSKNWVVNKIAAVYIEVIRNIPLLVQLMFWYFAVLSVLPLVGDSMSIGNNFFINNRGVNFPAIIPSTGFWLIPVALLVAIVASVVIGKWARKRQDLTGQIFPVFWTSVGLIIILPVIASLIMGGPFTISYPEFGRFSITGGWSLEPEFLALLLGLAIYTGAFIAEIVRSGINSVSHGQTEAAHSLGIRGSFTMRLVILPQALRVIVPPLTSQYLNLTKNSSLATAIGYADITAIFAGTSLNQTGQAIEVILITMLFYLSISLLISMFMNWYNKRIALVER